MPALTASIGGCASNRWMRFAYPPYVSYASSRSPYVHRHACVDFLALPFFSSQAMSGLRSKISRWASLGIFHRLCQTGLQQWLQAAALDFQFQHDALHRAVVALLFIQRPLNIKVSEG